MTDLNSKSRADSKKRTISSTEQIFNNIRREVREKSSDGSSSYSLNSQRTKMGQSQLNKELAITKKIKDLYIERETRMENTVRQTIFDDNLKIYKMFRKEQEGYLYELDRDRIKIQRRKKNKKETKRLLRANTRDKLMVICNILKKTVLYYKDLYYESDHYRLMRLNDILSGVVAEDGYTGDRSVTKADK